MEKATLKVNADVLDNAPTSSIAISKVDQNSQGSTVYQPIRDEGRRVENIESIVISEEQDEAEFLFTDGTTNTFDVLLFKVWDTEHEVQVFGASDDLVEFRGDISYESDAYPSAVFDVGGSLIIARFDANENGDWTFEIEQENGNLINIYEVGSEESEALSRHSQVLTVASDENIDSIRKIS